MVAPVTGPIREIINMPSFYSLRDKYKQKLPFDLVLPYSMRAAHLTAQVGFGAGGTVQNAASSDWGSEVYPHILSQAYERLKARMSTSTSLGVDFAEMNQSLTMIERRSLQLASFTRKIIRRDFIGAGRILSMSYVPRKAGFWRTFANNWLEYHFGWEPLVKDIQEAVQIITKPVLHSKIHATAKGPYVYRYTDRYPATGNIIASSVKRVDLMIAVKLGCRVTIQNSNAMLAAQLGLANPLPILWDITPWSFVLGWFSNIDQYLALGTDFCGLSVADAYTTVYRTGTKFHQSYSVYDTPALNSSSFAYFNMDRTLGLTLPSLHFKPWKPPSWKRAATAISLLVQLLPGSSGSYATRHLR